jgi:hypothetical protein
MEDTVAMPRVETRRVAVRSIAFHEKACKLMLFDFKKCEGLGSGFHADSTVGPELDPRLAIISF